MKLSRLFLRLVCALSGHPTFTSTFVAAEMRLGAVDPVLMGMERCFCCKRMRVGRIG